MQPINMALHPTRGECSAHVTVTNSHPTVAISVTEDSITYMPTKTSVPYGPRAVSTPDNMSTSCPSARAEPATPWLSAPATSSGRSSTFQMSSNEASRAAGHKPSSVGNYQQPTRLVQVHRRTKKNWYSVIVGHWTGIFDDWYTKQCLTMLI